MNPFDLLDVDALQIITLVYWLSLAFVLGAAVGSFVNVAVARLPLEKSLVWPGSRCGRCLQPVRWYDNLPLLSYLRLGGRCRTCGERFSSRYFWVELATALGFAGLFYAEVVANVHQWGPAGPRFFAVPPWPWLAGFLFHAVLFALLMAASVCDLRTREIPLGLTLTGTAIGLAGSAVLPWPWPWVPPQVAAPDLRPGLAASWAWQGGVIREGIYPWPFWGPLPAPFEPAGNWQTGLATGVLGALAGTFLLRAVAFLFGTGLGKEALGLGDADLMMMAGAFLGWQVVVMGFFLSVFPALLFGIVQLVVRGDNALPFGPSLSLGVLGTELGWPWVGPYVQGILFNPYIVLILFGAGAGILFGMAVLMRLVQPPAPIDPRPPEAGG